MIRFIVVIGLIVAGMAGGLAWVIERGTDAVMPVIQESVEDFTDEQKERAEERADEARKRLKKERRKLREAGR